MLLCATNLYGEEGIRPIIQTMKNINKVTNYWKKFYYFPSIFWNLCPSDNTIRGILITGIINSIIGIITIHKPICLLTNYIIYLSFVTMGSEFLYYQWDALILELTLTLAIYSYSQYNYLGYISLLLLFIRINIGNIHKKMATNDWFISNNFRNHLFTQPSPTKLALLLYNCPIICYILNYCILLYEAAISFLIILYPNIAIVLIVLYILLYMLTTGLKLYYLLYLGFTILLLPSNTFYYIPTPSINILHYLVYIIIIYSYYNHQYTKNYYIGNNYSIFCSITEKKYIFKFYYSNDNKSWQQIIPKIPNIEWQWHDHIGWQLKNSTILTPNVNSWIYYYVNRFIFKDNNIKYVKIKLFRQIPNSYNMVLNDNSWNSIDSKDYIIMTNDNYKGYQP